MISILVAALWGSGIFFVKRLVGGVSLLAIVGGRAIFASAAVLLALIVVLASRRERVEINWRMVTIAAAFSAGSQAFSVLALAFADAAVATPLLFMGSVYLWVITKLTGKKLGSANSRVMLGLTISISLMVGFRGISQIEGVVCGVIAGTLLGFTLLRFRTLKSIQEKGIALFLGTISLAPLAGNELWSGEISSHDLLFLALFGVIASAIPNMLLADVVKKDANIVGQLVLLSLEPVFGIASGWWVGERPPFPVLLGAVGIIFCAAYHKREETLRLRFPDVEVEP